MVETFSIHAKHYSGELWRNWKNARPVWTFLQAAGITEVFTTVETGICTCCIVEASMR
jgi:hypothetical protein